MDHKAVEQASKILAEQLDDYRVEDAAEVLLRATGGYEMEFVGTFALGSNVILPDGRKVVVLAIAVDEFPQFEKPEPLPDGHPMLDFCGIHPASMGKRTIAGDGEHAHPDSLDASRPWR